MYAPGYAPDLYAPGHAPGLSLGATVTVTAEPGRCARMPAAAGRANWGACGYCATAPGWAGAQGRRGRGAQKSCAPGPGGGAGRSKKVHGAL
jgi:hypothetical protein